MNKYTIQLQSPALRRDLPWRKYGYFQCFDRGRAVAYQPSTHRAGHWFARVLTGKRRFLSSTLGVADDFNNADGKTILSFDQALQQAETWCSHPSQSKHLSASSMFGRMNYLSYCPCGPDYTVGHVLAEYVAWKKAFTSESAYLTALSNVNCYLARLVGNIPVTELSHDHIYAMMLHIEATPANCPKRHLGYTVDPTTLDSETRRKRRVTANNNLYYLKAALNMAWEAGKIEDDRPWRRVIRFKDAVKPRTDILDEGEIDRLLAVCERDLAQLIVGILYTGCRITELLKMQVDDLSRHRQIVYVRPVKKYVGHYVTLPPQGYEFFKDLVGQRGDTELMFRREDGSRWTRHKLQPRIKHALQRAGLPSRYVFHTLRHTYASLRMQEGISPVAIARQLGHASIATVMSTYAHCSDDMMDTEIRTKFKSVHEISGQG